jgi:hypothetical protein
MSEGASYAIVQYSSSCVRATAVGAACSRSSVAMTVGTTDASDGGIHAAKNYVIVTYMQRKITWLKELTNSETNGPIVNTLITQVI